MKHKLLIGLIAVLGLTTAINITNQNVQASKSDDIFMYGFNTVAPEKHFKNWKKVVLLHNTDFDQSGALFYPDWEGRKTITLKKGTIIKLKYSPTDKEIDWSPISYWTASAKKLPKIDGNNIWYFDHIKSKFHNGQMMDALESKVATPSSYMGLSTIFRHRRKVKVVKPVTAYKIKQVIPAYKNHIVGKTKIKKGTMLTVTGPSNHWTLKVSGKGVKEHYPYIWNINKRSGWYKLIN